MCWAFIVICVMSLLMMRCCMQRNVPLFICDIIYVQEFTVLSYFLEILDLQDTKCLQTVKNTY